MSNPEKCADAAIEYASNLATAWDLGGYKQKQEIQNMLFPEGMSYNRKTDQCRTPRINEVFLQIAEQAHELTKNKNGNNTFVSLPSSFVPRTGVEPVIPPWKGGVLADWPTRPFPFGIAKVVKYFISQNFF